MILYYSGEASRANPEITLGDNANIMLTFFDMWRRDGQPTSRFAAVLRSRRLGRTSTKEDEPQTEAKE